jgi:ATP-binding cassette subfamily B protein
VAVTDEAHSAKSDLLELLLRLRRPHRGRLSIDGLDVRKIRVTDLRRQMGWVDREHKVTEIVSMSARTETGTLQRDLFEAAWAATERLAPDVGVEEGLELLQSAERMRQERRIPREMQLRLALSCALLGNPSILLVDDPTAGLDQDAVRRLTGWLQEIAKDKLVIVATNDSRIVDASSRRVHLRRARLTVHTEGDAVDQVISSNVAAVAVRAASA